VIGVRQVQLAVLVSITETSLCAAVGGRTGAAKALNDAGLPQKLCIRPVALKCRIHPIYSIRLFLDVRNENSPL
jgi:hypothetical protein